MSDIEDSTSASSLTAAVLDEEAARQASQAERSADVIFADDLLPGVGSDEMPLATGRAAGLSSKHAFKSFRASSPTRAGIGGPSVRLPK